MQDDPFRDVTWSEKQKYNFIQNYKELIQAREDEYFRDGCELSEDSLICIIIERDRVERHKKECQKLFEPIYVDTVFNYILNSTTKTVGSGLQKAFLSSFDTYEHLGSHWHPLTSHTDTQILDRFPIKTPHLFESFYAINNHSNSIFQFSNVDQYYEMYYEMDEIFSGTELRLRKFPLQNKIHNCPGLMDFGCTDAHPCKDVKNFCENKDATGHSNSYYELAASKFLYVLEIKFPDKYKYFS